MTFSFTDEVISDAFVSTAVRNPGIVIRVLADWTQRAKDGRQQVGRLADAGLPNLQVRYKRDQPYIWDARSDRLRWSYHASRGMLHHKTLSVVVDGMPWCLACGSFNWSGGGRTGYENVVIVSGECKSCRDLMSRMDAEFRALWSDERESFSPEGAQAYYDFIKRSAGNAVANSDGRGMTPNPLSGLGQLMSTSKSATPLESKEGAVTLDDSDVADVLIAFSARRYNEARGGNGYAEINRQRQILLRLPSGKRKRAPLTITSLALDLIYRARPGDTLRVAMYGLSRRVAEYEALIDATRRGVNVRLLLDRKVGRRTAESLLQVASRESLPITVKAGRRVMHEKYIVNKDGATVLTGTANMSTDASERHSEHRMLIFAKPHAGPLILGGFRENLGSSPGFRYLKNTRRAEARLV